METGTRQLTSTDLNQVTTSKTESYGARGETSDGRQFRYVSFGGTTTIAPGLLVVAPATVANYTSLAVTAVGTGGQVAGNLVSGSTALVVTNGATAVAQDAFAEGVLEVKQTSGSNNGPIVYKVKGNTAAAASGTFTVFLDAREPLRNASTLVAGTDTVNLAASYFAGVAPSTTLGVAVGVTPVQIPQSASVTYYGWVQSSGPALITNDAGGALAVGTAAAQSTTTAGTFVAAGATSNDIAQVRAAINASTVGPARLTIDL